MIINHCFCANKYSLLKDNISDPKEPKFIRALVTAVCEGCRKGNMSV